MAGMSAWGLIDQGADCFDAEDCRGALGRFEQAVKQARQEGDIRAELNALSWQTVCWHNLGECRKEANLAAVLLARARQTGNEEYQMRAVLALCQGLATIDLRSRWSEIRPLLEEGLTSARRLGDNYYEVSLLMRLGEHAVSMGEDECALAWLQEALTSLQPATQHGAFFRSSINRYLSRLMCRRGQPAEALRYAQIALRAAHEHHKPMTVAGCQLAMARASWEGAERDTALELVKDVLIQARERGWRNYQQQAEYLCGEWLRELGHASEAMESAQRSLELARELELKEEEVESLLSLGQALLDQKRMEEGQGVLRDALWLSQERDYPDHLQEAETLLS